MFKRKALVSAWQASTHLGLSESFRERLWSRVVEGLDAKRRRLWDRARDLWLLDWSYLKPAPNAVRLYVDVDVEVGGQWIADVIDLPGVLAYGKTRDEAVSNARVLALRVLADQIDAGERAAVASIAFVE